MIAERSTYPEPLNRFVVAVVLSSVAALVPANAARAGDQGTVVESSADLFVMRDDRGDQAATPLTSTAVRQAADVRRVKVWRDGPARLLKVTLRGDVRSVEIDLWSAWVTILPRDAELDTFVRVRLSRSRARFHGYDPEGPQYLCARRVRIEDQGRSVVVRVPRGCGWRSAKQVGVTTTARGFDETSATDAVHGRSRLK